MTSLEEIFEQFLKERTYLKGPSPKTLTFYCSSFRAYQKFSGSATLPTKAGLNAFVTGVRGREEGRFLLHLRPGDELLSVLAL